MTLFKRLNNRATTEKRLGVIFQRLSFNNTYLAKRIDKMLVRFIYRYCGN